MQVSQTSIPGLEDLVVSPVTAEVTEDLPDYAITDPQRIGEVLNVLVEQPFYAFDVETTSLDFSRGKLHGMSFATADKMWYVFGNALEPAIHQLVDMHKRHPKIGVIGHNLKFDLHFMAPYGYRPKFICDTQIAQKLIDENVQRKLKTLAYTRLGIEGLPTYEDLAKAAAVSYVCKTRSCPNRTQQVQYKAPGICPICGKPLGTERKKVDDVSIYDIPLSKLVPYAARDTRLTYDLWLGYKPELKSEGMWDIFFKYEMPFLYVLLDMEKNGIYINQEKVSVLEKEIMERMQEARHTWDTVTGGVNPSSTTQLPEYLFETLKLKVQGYTDTGKPSTDALALQRLEPLDKTGSVKALRTVREMEKLLSTYIRKFQTMVNEDGRMRTNFNQDGARTGRLSSSGTINLQNIPSRSDLGKRIRDAFTAADDDHVIMVCVPEGTRVATTAGYLPIETVVPGDMAFMEDGSATEITALLDHGVQPVYKITTSMGYEIRATPSHRVRVIDEQGDYVWRFIDELQQGDHIVVQSGRGLGWINGYVMLPPVTSNHPNNKPVYTPEYLDEDLALFLGYLTGDGTLQKDRKGVAYVVNQRDAAVHQYLYSLSTRLFGLEPHVHTYRGVFDTTLHSVPLFTWLNGLGAAKNSVPPQLWQSPETVVAAYLRGLFEADGSVQSTDTGRVSFSTIHEQLAWEVHQLLLLLGIPARKYKQVHGKGVGYIWMITVSSAYVATFAEKVGFLSEHKSHHLSRLVARVDNPKLGGYPHLKEKVRRLGLHGEVRRLLNNTAVKGTPVSLPLANTLVNEYPDVAYTLGLHRTAVYGQLFDTIASITFDGDAHVYDLTVPATHTYISNGFVSHNCDYSQLELRLVAHYSGEPQMISAFENGDDPHQITADLMGVPRYVGKTINFGCVPMDTTALTPDGWASYNDLSVGDAVMGYNPATKQMEWTRVLHKFYYEEAPLVRMKVNRRFDVCVTPNHRWFAERRRHLAGGLRPTVGGFVETQDITTEHNLILSAPASTPHILDISPDEAAIIAWLHTDGSIKRGKYTGAPAQAGGSKVSFEGRILQKKEGGKKHIEKILADVPHYTHQHRLGVTHYMIDPAYLRDLWFRSGLDQVNLEQFVSLLDPYQRREFMIAAYLAEGNTSEKQLAAGRFHITQNEGPVMDALRLGAFLEGHYVGQWENGRYKDNVNARINLSRPHITGQHLRIEEDGSAPVWCIQTELGTWVMRQGDQIMVTGNSVYGQGPRTLADTIEESGKPRPKESEAKEWLQLFRKAYPTLDRWKWAQVDLARTQGYVTTLLGRKRRIPDINSFDNGLRGTAERQSYNAPIQGSAADTAELAMLNVHPYLSDYSARMLLQVHDELVFEVHKDSAEEFGKIVQSKMEGVGEIFDLRVKLEAGPGIGESWASAKH
jgi:DNA polymerase I-like protein with 3'-5' exonuclease and polymerase domains